MTTVKDFADAFSPTDKTYQRSNTITNLQRIAAFFQLESGFAPEARPTPIYMADKRDVVRGQCDYSSKGEIKEADGRLDRCFFLKRLDD